LQNFIGSGSTLPGSCTNASAGAPPNFFFLTTPPATSGQNWYGCLGGTYVLMSGSGFFTGAGVGIQSVSGNATLDTAVALTRHRGISGADKNIISAGGNNTTYTGCPSGFTIISGDVIKGMELKWWPDVNGVGGPTTFNPCAISAYTLKQFDGVTDPTSGSIVAGEYYNITFDGTNFRLPSAGSSGVSPITLISHALAVGAGGSAPATTSAINTTGATLLVVAVTDYGITNSCLDTISDSKSNTWVGIQAYYGGGGQAGTCIFYAANPTVGTGHTFTGSGGNITVMASAGSNVATSSPLDVQNGGTNTGSMTQSTGSVTPNQNSEMCLASGGTYAGNTSLSFASPTNAYTLMDSVMSTNSINVTSGHAYFIETTAAATSTTFTVVGGLGPTYIVAAVACFKHT
jgi:hypothetical protein